jgi:glycerol-3-phosphate O-acyltransferase
LPPKFGLLNMIVDAALAVPERPTLFVPVSIGYERVIEARSYELELQGGEKAKEDAAGLFKSRDVLRHRYGRISMQVGQVLTLDEIRQELGVPPDGALTPAKRRALVTRLGNRVMDEINRVTAVTPGALTALVLLAHDQRGVAHDELVARVERLLAVLDRMGARKSPALYTATGALRGESIRESLQMFADTELLEIHVPARVPGSGTARRGRAGPGAFYVVTNDQRLALDTSKNVIVHFFVERALVALAVLAAPEPPPPLDWVRERVRALSRLFKHEFRFRADRPFESIFDETIAEMSSALELELDAGRVRPGPGHHGWSGADWLDCYASLLASLLEGYRVAARALRLLEKGPLGEKELVKRSLALGREMFLAGEIERREAISKPTLENAFESFSDQGVLVHRESYDLAPSATRETALADVEQTLVSYLPRRGA